MKKIKPIGKETFYDFFLVYNNITEDNNYDYFSETIRNLPNGAIGPYFWFIVSSIKTTTMDYCSDNINQLTPFTKEEWLSSPDFFVDLIHPDDRFYILSAITFASNIYMEMSKIPHHNITINIYGRILDKNRNYRWALWQCPKSYINKEQKTESSLIVFYDLSHFQITNAPLLSVFDHTNDNVQYFKHIDREIEEVKTLEAIPKISKREKEILCLMAQGYTTPEISKKLFISSNTVNNHKTNLRRKTNTKSASELIAYSMTRSIFLI